VYLICSFTAACNAAAVLKSLGHAHAFQGLEFPHLDANWNSPSATLTAVVSILSRSKPSSSIAEESVDRLCVVPHVKMLTRRSASPQFTGDGSHNLQQ